MKKGIITVLLAVLVLPAIAQNRSINFEKLTFKEAMDKAKKENKLVFVDLHAVWCAECRVLDRDVFGKDEVADYHNTAFVNVDYDVDQDEDGKMIRENYKPKAYPTVLYFDPNTGEEVHRKVGVPTWERFLEISKAANDPSGNMKAVWERFEQGERSEGFMLIYFASLYDASMMNELRAAMNSYYDGYSDREFVSVTTFRELEKYVQLLFEPVVQRLIRLKGEFYKIIPQHEVDGYIRLVVARRVLSVNPPPILSGGKANDPDQIEELIDYLKTVNLNMITTLESLYLAMYELRGDFVNYLSMMEAGFKLNMFTSTENGSIANFFSTMMKCDDQAILRRAYDLLYEQSQRSYYASNVMEVFDRNLPLLKARLQ